MLNRLLDAAQLRLGKLPRAQTLEQVEALLPTAIEPDALIAAVKDAVR